MLVKLFKVNLVLIIGILVSWLLKSFGNVDSFYIFLLLFLIPINLYLIYPNKKNPKS